MYVKFSPDGTLYKYDSIRDVRSVHFDRHETLLRKVNSPFYLVLEVVPGKDKFGIWALDDVSFTSACQPADPKAVTNPAFTPYPVTTVAPNGCNGTDFLCDGYMCILRYVLHTM